MFDFLFLRYREQMALWLLEYHFKQCHCLSRKTTNSKILKFFHLKPEFRYLNELHQQS